MKDGFSMEITNGRRSFYEKTYAKHYKENGIKQEGEA